ncbi:MAG: aldehyde dehydrogenase family protein, partial [Actinomycetota bacterium]
MQTNLLIDGSWHEGSETLSVLDPSTGAHVADVAAGTAADAVAACDAAAEAQKRWAAQAPRVRSEVLRSCWQTMVDHSDELAELITTEHGKPLVDAKGEVAYAAEFFRWNAEEAVRLHGSIGTAPSGANSIIVRHPPVGVVLIITPWNFPAAMITRKVAPALAAGNSVVIKPAEDTPLTALRVAELLEQAGVPAGVVNVVPTTDPGSWFEAAVDHPAVRMVSFTGSTETGRLLLRRSADRVLKVGMELGGNAPFIVFDDADIDAAVEGAMVAKMRHSAQTCTAANRFFVEAGVVDEFTGKLAEAMAALTVGNGFTDGVDCGPVINEAAMTKIDGLVKGATGAGAT